MKENYIWAKKSEKDGMYSWMSLYQHLTDTRNIAGLLWEHWLSLGQKKTILSSIDSQDESDGKNLLLFLAAIHDIGKATPAFQTQKGFRNSDDLDRLLIERLEGDGFSNLSSTNLPDRDKSHHALAGQFILINYGVKEEVASIIGSHHGKPSNNENFYEEQKGYLTNYYQEERGFKGVDKKWEKAQNEILNWALKSNGYEIVQDLPSISQLGQVILSGLVIMADWIASNENYFPLLDLEIYLVDNQMKRLSNGWGSWFITSSIEARYRVDIVEHYEARFKFEPRDVQKVFSEVIENTDKPGIFILEAPMGLGKTEAALIGSEQLAYKTGRIGIFFGLPTQATSDGIFPRFQSWLDTIREEEDENISIKLVHGKSSLNEGYASLARNINVDEDKETAIITNQWFAGRKTAMLDDFVIGTVDHFLLAALKQGHLALRHLGLSKKVVIIDEVHAYDVYMGQYLEKAIEWMGAYNVPVILLSATLTAQSRNRLTEAYLSGKGIKKSKIKFSQKYLDTMSYPLITYIDGNEIIQKDDFKDIKNKAIQIKILDKDDLYMKLEEHLSGQGIIGIIVNTVKNAQEIAVKCSQLFGEEFVFLLHSNFIATERADKEKELLNMIGKGADRPRKKIIIGTQVIEQSLDVDFDLMISELAPMDLIIQRIGRLHRHKIERPEKFKEPVLYVMGTSTELDFEPGSDYIYGGYLLARTQYFLPDILNIPGDISHLVQKVYDEEDIILDFNLEEKYTNMKKKFHTNIIKKKDRAKTYLLSSPKYEARRGKSLSLIKWLNNDYPNQSEEQGYAQVRDSQITIEVVALKTCKGGYSFIDGNEDISKHINNPKISKKIASSTLRLPLQFSMYGNADKTIKELEKYNLKYLSEWQSQVWLKGLLGIIFDKNGNFELNNRTLHYDRQYGLTYREEEFNGKV